MADTDAAEAGAIAARQGQQGRQILLQAQQQLGQNIDDIGSSHTSGRQQLGQSRGNMEAVWRQLGLDPAAIKHELSAPDTSEQSRQLDAVKRLNAGEPMRPETRGIEDYSMEELGQIVAQREAQQKLRDERSQAMQNWVRERMGLPPLGQPTPTPAAPDDTQRRDRMRDLSRTWNAY
jgi:hypothetical protein